MIQTAANDQIGYVIMVYVGDAYRVGARHIDDRAGGEMPIAIVTPDPKSGAVTIVACDPPGHRDRRRRRHPQAQTRLMVTRSAWWLKVAAHVQPEGRRQAPAVEDRIRQVIAVDVPEGHLELGRRERHLLSQ